MTMTMNNYTEYCIKECKKGILKKTELIDTCDSIIDAVFDMQAFIDNCIKTCEKINNKEVDKI